MSFWFVLCKCYCSFGIVCAEIMGHYFTVCGTYTVVVCVMLVWCMLCFHFV